MQGDTPYQERIKNEFKEYIQNLENTSDIDVPNISKVLETFETRFNQLPEQSSSNVILNALHTDQQRPKLASNISLVTKQPSDNKTLSGNQATQSRTLNYMDLGSMGGLGVGILIAIGLLASGWLAPLGAVVLGVVIAAAILGPVLAGVSVGYAMDSSVEMKSIEESGSQPLPPRKENTQQPNSDHRARSHSNPESLTRPSNPQVLRSPSNPQSLTRPSYTFLINPKDIPSMPDDDNNPENNDEKQNTFH